MARRTPQQPRAIVGAARRIDLKRKVKARKPEEWQADCWGYYDSVTEAKELILWRGSQLAKLKMYIAALPPDAGPEDEPIPARDPDSGIPLAVAEMAEQELNRVRSQVGGQAEILRRFEMNLEVAGEGYVVGLAARIVNEKGEAVATGVEAERRLEDGERLEPEDWCFASIDEVASKGTTTGTVWTLKRNQSEGQPRTLDPENDTIFRVWQPHPRYFEEPDCALKGTLDVCEILSLLTNQVKAEARSRAGAGIFVMPNTLSFGPPEQTTPESGQEAPADDFLDKFGTALTAPILNPGDAGSVVPMLLRGPKDDLGPDVLRHIDLSRQSDSTLDERIEKNVGRLARGLNAPPEVMLGSAQTTFRNADQIDDDIYEDYLEPRAIFMVDAFTVGWIHPRLSDLGVDPEILRRLFVWPDTSGMVRQPDQAEHADAAHDRFAISDAAYRRALHYDESDAPTPEETLIRLALKRGLLAANVTAALLETMEGAPDLPEPDNPTQTQARFLAAAKALGIDDDVALSLFAAADAHNPGVDLVAIDRELRTRLLVAANDAMTRALERAGAKLRSSNRITRGTLANVSPILAASTLGREAVTAAGIDEDDLLAGAFDALESQFKTWAGSAQTQAINVVNKIVGGFTTAQRDRMGLRLAESIDEAWTWMKGALVSLAHAKLYDPNPIAPAVGEFDPSLRVPPGLVRQAVARAGGAAGLTTNGEGGAWIALSDGGTAPAGGIATGEIAKDTLRENGVVIEGYVWDYGVGMRKQPFPPHEALSGRTFDDDALANYSGYPETSHYMPGDHSGSVAAGNYMPGDHSGSVAAGTIVEGLTPSAQSLRWYEGTLVELTTAAGNLLAVTLNHPVLTDRGWVPAQAVVEGDHVIRCLEAERASDAIPHQHQGPARVEDLFAARWIRPGVIAAAVPVAPEHFHGDGKGGEIAVVCAERDLSGDGHATGSQPVGHVDLRRARRLADQLASARRPFAGLPAVGLPPLAGVGESSDAHALLRGATRGENELRVAHAAWLDTERPESFVDGVSIDAEALGQSLDGLTGLVQLDKVLSVDRHRGFKGHVFDLQTANHWYVAGGLIVHNCLCDAVPILIPPGE